MDDEFEPKPAPIDTYATKFLKFKITEAAIKRE
jgi:hypothetical protein